MPEDSFDDTPNLQQLWLGGNSFGSLLPGVFNMPYLWQLTLDGNGLVSLPPGIFENLLELEYLDADDNGFDCIPREAFGSRTDDFSNIRVSYGDPTITLCS